MHDDVFRWVAVQVGEHGPFGTVVEFGSRDINGSVRPLFPGAEYIGVDVVEGPGVDVVADAAEWEPVGRLDCAVCCEVLEHVSDPEAIVASMARALRSGGVALITAACEPRFGHSAVDGGALRPGEHYANVDPDDLKAWLAARFSHCDVECHERGDVYAVAVR